MTFAASTVGYIKLIYARKMICIYFVDRKNCKILFQMDIDCRDFLVCISKRSDAVCMAILEQLKDYFFV